MKRPQLRSEAVEQRSLSLLRSCTVASLADAALGCVEKASLGRSPPYNHETPIYIPIYRL
jgi:hypothetical protein